VTARPDVQAPHRRPAAADRGAAGTGHPDRRRRQRIPRGRGRRRRLLSPSAPTWTRQSSASRFQHFRASSSARSLIGPAPLKCFSPRKRAGRVSLSSKRVARLFHQTRMTVADKPKPQGTRKRGPVSRPRHRPLRPLTHSSPPPHALVAHRSSHPAPSLLSAE
jgi:hypothetical protein